LAIGLQDITGARQPGTPPAYLTGPNATYYIGGPPVTLSPTTNQQQTAQLTTQQSPQTMTVDNPPAQDDTPASVDNTPLPSDPMTAPKFNLINQRFVITPGGSSAPTKPAVTNLPGTKLNHPIADGVKHLVNSAKSALRGLSKLATRRSIGSGQPTGDSN
jgi:hypothetical protein